MALDHGVLNIPLHKRGNIDREIDKWKAEQAALQKERVQLAKCELKDNKAEAKRLWALADQALIKADAKRRGIRYTELRDILDGFVKWEPKKAIKVLPIFIK
ncbi:hypothetical protein [Xenorhabdus bovienii]|uniref:Uncharacterized protein n=1 Tax=Xenorhabdus bovienii str. feltiae Moldova TaxID=1398200 RepID=A0A077NNQ5_XENBV|nr:hypothetical protein [Xenorhabdus bovienii]CDH00540.1 conserved hypothetical protein [Xenorhabdus bovienii str. feltiae Moldova]